MRRSTREWRHTWSRTPLFCAIRAGGRCRFLSRTIATIPFPPRCCFPFTRARRLILPWAENADGSDVKIKGKVIRSGFVPIHYVNGYPQQTSTQPIVEVDGVLRFGLP